MRLIDADALKERIRKALGIKSFDNLLPSEKTIVKQIDMASTIQPEPHWIPVTEEELFKAGYEGKEIRFRVDGRLFAIRELAQ